MSYPRQAVLLAACALLAPALIATTARAQPIDLHPPRAARRRPCDRTPC